MQASLAAALGVQQARPAAGGCIHRCYEVRVSGERRFLKTNSADRADAFAAEADGLQALRAAGLTAPQPLAHGVAGGEAYLLMEYLELGGAPDWGALGRMLALAHRRGGPRFGWHRDNYIGTTPQQNGWSDDWAQFWVERRLRPQLALARHQGFTLREPSCEVLRGHRPAPALLHGDLWRGNAGFTPGGPVVFDPAVYHGDREADLAMTELFGGFAPEFYAGYAEVWPLEDGYERRKPLYNLYHLLNHLNLFGGGYLGQVEATLRLLLRA